MNKFNYSKHALKRMEERNISEDKIELIMECGQMFYSGNYKYVIKYSEITGSISINYRVIYHKSDKTIITVYVFEKRIKEETISCDKTKGIKKAFKNKKRSIKKQEEDEYYEEELKKFNIRK